MKTPWGWLLDPGLCVGCGVCADLCHVNALAHPASTALPVAIPGRCVGCQVCVHECPTGAIMVRRASPKDAHQQR